MAGFWNSTNAFVASYSNDAAVNLNANDSESFKSFSPLLPILIILLVSISIAGFVYYRNGAEPFEYVLGR